MGLSSRARTVTALLVLAALGCAGLAAVSPGATYPGPGGGTCPAWTGESALDWRDPHHVQAAAAGGCLYVVADNGSDVRFARSSSGGATFSGAAVLDYQQSNPARDAYITASGANVAVSWKELTGATWALVVAFSTDGGATWSRYRDANPACNNFEAHLAMAGGRVHGAYVADATGQNEVFYRRWSYDGALEVDYRQVSDPGGCADTQPCLEASDANSLSVYYRHEEGPDACILQSMTYNGGADWSRQLRLYHVDVDSAWPECARYGNRVTLICQGAFRLSGVHAMQFTSFNGSEWGAAGAYDADTGAEAPYYQLASCGGEVLVSYRDTGGEGTPARRVSGFYNANGGTGGQWQYVNQLFYGNMAYDNPGSTDVCSDGSRFYAVSAGTGTYNKVLVKREDLANPAASVADPGRFHNADFTVGASADDCSDWDFDGSWYLSPGSQAYQDGIVEATFSYKLASAGSWSSVADADAPWSFTFPASTVPQGQYNLKVRVKDTADKTTEAVYSSTVFVDRTAPQASGLLTGGLKEEGAAWYRTPPTVTGSYADGAGCGVDAATRQYRVGSGEWQDYPEGGFAALEGSNDYSFRCADLAGNQSSASPQALNVKVDTQAPVPSAALPAADGLDGWRRTDASATVTLSATDNAGGSGAAGIRYAWDATPADEYAAPLVCPEGTHTLYFQARDAAGNWSETVAREVWKDTTPPAVSIVEPAGDRWIRGMVTVKADATDNCRTGSVDFYMDGEAFDHREGAPWMASLDTTAWNNDYHTLSVTATDAAGNSSPAGGAAQVEVFVGNNISETNNFAEGCTRAGFDTWLCLQNPGDEAAGVTVNYMLGPGQGAASARSYSVPGHSRTTILVNNDVGPDKDVSIQVTSSRPIVSERPIYFDYRSAGGQGWKGCHTAQGASVPREEWYLAEGCTRDGFEEWICIQNPGEEPADVRIEYMLGDGRTIARDYRVNNWQRYTVPVNGEVGPGHDVSAHITSSAPVVVERPLYFLYQGMWDGGHNVMGAHRPETCWYFAEGCTRSGFNQWLCIQNPNAEKAVVDVGYMTEDGGLISKQYVVSARSRYTINVNDDVARQHDVSTRIVSDLPIVAERPMYFLYKMSLDEGSDAMGTNKPCSSWYLAEGCTRGGFEEYVCLQNPGSREARVLLRFMLEDCSVREHTVVVAPGFRVTLKVNDLVGEGHDVSTEIMSDEPVVCERPMYAVYGGDIQAADTLSGYTFDK